MRIAKIEKMSLSNGPGIRVCLYTQGCPFRCEDCFNSEIWDFDGGKAWNEIEDLKEIFELSNHDYISGLSILGGEPLIDQNIEALARLCIKYKSHFPNKTIWIWTGWEWEDLLKCYKNTHAFQTLLDNVDVIIDGPFKKELKDPSLKWKGSSNQRTIDVQKSLKENEVILYDI